MGHEELFRKIGGAKPLTNYGDRIAKGEHVLDLKEYAVRQTEGKGTIVAADFMVVESTVHAPGGLVGCAWFVSDGGWQGERELSRAQAFVKALLGVSDPEDAAKAANQLRSDAQPGRGIRVRCRGVPKGEKGFVEPQFSHVIQTPEEIRTRRAAIEARYPDQPAPAAAPPPAQVQPTAPSGNLLGGLLGR